MKTSIQIGRKICIFPWELVHGFGQKLDICLTFLLGKMCRGKLFRDVLDIIIAFLDYKNINTNRSKNLHFFKGASP